MSREPLTGKCGTTAGSAAHYRAGEKPCEDCRRARNEYARRYGRAHGQEPDFAYSAVRQYVTGVEDMDFVSEFFRSDVR